MISFRSLLIDAALVAVGAMPVRGQAFGSALAVVDGDVLVGETNTDYRPGTVYVYRKNGGSWREVATVTAADAQFGDGFGRSLAYDGETLFIGATGSVHLLRKEAGNWKPIGVVLTSPDTSTDSNAFGTSLAHSDDWLFVGDPRANQARGAIYVFRRDANGSWTEHLMLDSGDTTRTARRPEFGSSLAAEGRTLLVSASYTSDGPPRRTNLVHVFELDEDGRTWKEAGSFVPGGPEGYEHSGQDVTLRNGTAYVTAPSWEGGYGRVFVFHRDPESGKWAEVVRLSPLAMRRHAAFGSSFAIDDQNILIRSRSGVHALRSGPGDSTFQVVGTMVPSNLQEGDNFGSRIALEGDIAAVRASGRDNGVGAVFIFDRDGGGEWVSHGPFISPVDEMPNITETPMECGKEGKAAEIFDCNAIELLAYMPPSSLTLDGGRGERFNDIWGWTDPETGREYALLGRSTGTSLIDVTDPVNPSLIADLPRTEGARPSNWRDIKVYRDHAFIVSESFDHGVQVFDLTQVRNAKNAPVTFQQTAYYAGVNAAHNIAINEESGFAYSVGNNSGGETCGGGLHMIDIRDPRNPSFAGCYNDVTAGSAQSGYTHDAQCVIYHGPDTRYHGREICLGFNDKHLSIADVTDKKAPKAVSLATYPNVAYAHQGWFSEDQRYMFMNDELDEGQMRSRGETPRSRTIIWDLSDLEDPIVASEFFSTEGATDHNLYVKGDLVFQSNYRAGLRVLDISDPAAPVEAAYFDTHPYGENIPGYSRGTWSNYPFFESGTIIVSGMKEGLFVLKLRDAETAL